MREDTSRRALMAAGAAVLATGTLAGCGSDDDGGGTGASTPPATTGAGTPAESAPPSASASAPAEASGTPGEALLKTSEVPVGGGTVLAGKKIVVTQPTTGEFKAFSAVCTHRGCTVNKVAEGTIDCPCHGSRFAVGDGAVVHGPAKKPLPGKEITVEGGEIRLA
ncbi:Rieske (2Fe-2S) protein [Streptomyces sp. NPDC086023]|uniref:Rieske (2Fe-2S) protein n=1 Tax=Streptomyces sp. NPDC086023 TaxID=3365746 RepID=UPI0037D851E2